MDLPTSRLDLGAWSAVEWSAAGTVTTAAVAVIAAIFAGMQVRHARQLRDEQAQPYVVVDIDVAPGTNHILLLIIENVGKTLAQDVRITFDRKIEVATDTHGFDINESALLSRGIPSMPPGKRITAIFDNAAKRYKTDLPMSYTATAYFKDGRARKQKPLKYVLDISVMYGLMNLRERGLADVANSLHEIDQTLKKWTGLQGRLNIWSRDEDYKSWADSWHVDRAGMPPMLNNRNPAGRPAPTPYDALRESRPRRTYWYLRNAIVRIIWPMRERREIRRLDKRGRTDLASIRRQRLKRRKA